MMSHPDGLRKRGGFVSIMALAVIVMISALSIELARSLVRRQLTENHQVQIVQAELLAQAGLDQAARQFRMDPKRTSLPDWIPKLPENQGTAIVRYQWKPEPNSNSQSIQILAELQTPDHQIIRSRLSGQISLPETDTSETRPNEGTP